MIYETVSCFAAADSQINSNSPPLPLVPKLPFGNAIAREIIRRSEFAVKQSFTNNRIAKQELRNEEIPTP